MKLSKKETREILVKSKGLSLSEQEKKIHYIATAALCLFFIPAFVSVSIWVLHISIPAIITFVILYILLSLSMVLIYFHFANKTPSSKRINKELSSLENDIEDEAHRIITKSLGKTIYRELNPLQFSVDYHQVSLCKNLLKKSEVINDSNLKFHVYLKLYGWYYIDESFDKALDAIKFALTINPEKVIVRIWLAELYEYIGKGEKAIIVYESIKDLPAISSNIMVFIDMQVKRIKEKGPRKAPPITGLRYMAY